MTMIGACTDLQVHGAKNKTVNNIHYASQFIPNNDFAAFKHMQRENMNQYL